MQSYDWSRNYGNGEANFPNGQSPENHFGERLAEQHRALLNGDPDSITGPRAAETLKQFELPKPYHTGGNLLDLGITEMPFLLEGIFPAHTLCALAGSSDTGKSRFLHQLCIAVASGAPTFLDFPLRTKHQRAIFVSTEDGPFEISFILNQYKAATGVSRDAIDRVLYITETGNLLETLDQVLLETPADVVVLDAFGDLFSGREMNANAQVRQYLQPFAELAARHRTTVLFNHHTGKGAEREPPDKKGIIGSQGFEAKMRAVAILKRDHYDAAIRHLCLVKGNYAPDEYKHDSFALRTSSEFVFSNTGDRVPFGELVPPEPGEAQNELQDQVAQMLAENKSQRQIARELGRSSSAINRIVKKLDEGN
jgi:hypothetical protein